MASHTGNMKTPRRIRVLLNVDGQIMRGHAISIGIDQIIVSVPSAIERDRECALFFGLTIGDQIFSIIGNGRVTRCTAHDVDSHYAEMQFSVSDKKSRIAIEQLFGGERSNCIQ